MACSQINSNITSLGKSVADGKTAVAAAISAKGVSTAADATFAVMADNISKISTGLPILNYSANGTRSYADFPIPKGYKKISGSFSNASTMGTPTTVVIVYNNVTVYNNSAIATTKSFTKNFDGNSTGYISYSYFTSEESSSGTFNATVTP